MQRDAMTRPVDWRVNSPKRRNASWYDRCDPHCPNLAWLFSPDSD